MNTLAMYRRLSGIPFGRELFSKAVCRIAPYFSSINPTIETLEPGLVKVSIRNRRSVQNHLKTVHAIAMCNMAELAGGMMTDISIPKGARWIPAGMTVKYLKKAKTDLTAVADGRNIDWSINGDIVVPVEISNTEGELVFTAHITMNVKQAEQPVLKAA